MRRRWQPDPNEDDMVATRRTRTALAMGIGLAVAAVATMLASAASPKFLADDPLQVEAYTQDASGTKAAELKLFTDLAYNFIKGSDEISSVRAQNINTVDELPDSSWFTNRAGVRPLTPQEVAVGPDTDNGPASGTWTVTSSKSDGVTPGFTVSDSTGQRWFLKFDARGYRAMTTGTDA